MAESGVGESGLAQSGSALQPRVAETHTGLVVLIGELAYKTKKPVVTDFLDFSTADSRERACAHEVELNRRLAPDSYLGVGHFRLGDTVEPVIVMRRHPDERRLATLVRHGADVGADLRSIAALLADFHARAGRGPAIDDQARVAAVGARWRENLDELTRYARAGVGGLDEQTVVRAATLVESYLAGRAALFDRRIAERRIVDGHADLLTDDIFCLPEGPAVLDCLEFDDLLRYVDVIDDVSFLAMDLEFLGRPDLAEEFLRHYRDRSGDDAPDSLRHFYTAYRAVVRAKVDCVLVTQGRTDAAADARRHLDIAVDHLRRGRLRMILVGGGPGTGKTTLARALADAVGAESISTDDVRADLVASGEISGAAGVLGEGRYTPENITAVYTAVLRRAGQVLDQGRSVVLDGTWGHAEHRRMARDAAAAAGAVVLELACAASLSAAVGRIRHRTDTTSEVTPQIAAALAEGGDGVWAEAHRIDTTRTPAESLAEAVAVCSTFHH